MPNETLVALAKLIYSCAKQFQLLDLLLLELGVHLTLLVIMRTEFEENDAHETAEFLTLTKRCQVFELIQIFIDCQHHLNFSLFDKAGEECWDTIVSRLEEALNDRDIVKELLVALGLVKAEPELALIGVRLVFLLRLQSELGLDDLGRQSAHSLKSFPKVCL